MNNKYIVYQTINNINSKLYIGVHKTKNPDIFDGYIGNGIWINQECTYMYAKTKMQAAVKKYGTKSFTRHILKIFDTPEEAYALERELVNEEFLSRPDVYNMVLGGEIQDYKEIPVFRFDLNGNFMAEYNSMSDAADDVGCNKNTIGEAIKYRIKIKNSLWTVIKTETIDINTFRITIKDEKKPIYMYTKDGKFYKEFDSRLDAAKFLKLKSSVDISRASKLGYISNGYYFSDIKDEEYARARTTYLKIRPVHKYDSKGNYLESYDTQSEAEINNKFSNISKSIRLKSIDENGFMWSLEKLPTFNAPKKNRKKKVVRLDENGNIAEQWDSIGQCSKIWGTGVKHCLYGQYKTHKGYIFKFIE